MSGFQKTLALFALGAASFFPRAAKSQDAAKLWIASPSDGVAVDCGEGEKFVRAVHYYFNKKIKYDSLMEMHQIKFDKITVTPATQKLDYFSEMEWFHYTDGSTSFEVIDPAKTVAYTGNKNDPLSAAASQFIKVAEEACKAEPLRQGYMMPMGIESPISKAAMKIQEILSIK